MANHMQVPTHKLHRSFWSFWSHGFKKAAKKSWEHYDKAIVVFGLIYTIIAIILCKTKLAEKKPEGLDMSTWVALIIPGILLVIFLVYNLFRAPYEIYLEQQKKHTEHMEEKDTTIAELKLVISSQASKLEEKNEADKLVIAKQAAKEALGFKHMALHNRWNEARAVESYKFAGELKDKEDKVTSDLFQETEAVMWKHLLIAEAARFRAAMPAPLKSSNAPNDIFSDRIMDWRWHINYIAAKRDKLEEIIKELG